MLNLSYIYAEPDHDLILNFLKSRIRKKKIQNPYCLAGCPIWLSRLSYHGFPVTTVLLWQSGPGCPLLAVIKNNWKKRIISKAQYFTRIKYLVERFRFKDRIQDLSCYDSITNPEHYGKSKKCPRFLVLHSWAIPELQIFLCVETCLPGHLPDALVIDVRRKTGLLFLGMWARCSASWW